MKKISILIITCFSLLLTISCSKDDEGSSSSSFNPPNWIIGTWLDKNEPEWSQIGGFKFTSDNIIDLNADGQEILNYDQSFAIGLKSGTMKIDETITNEVYQIIINTSGITTLNYTFNKGSSNSIIYELNATQKVELTKQ